MLKFDKFKGINNVKPSVRLKPNEQRAAFNIDYGLDNEARRRYGYTTISLGQWENLWQANGFILATLDSALVAFTMNPNTVTVLHPTLGCDPRVWYVNLPDGRTAFSNGLINGITDGTTVTGWGVPVPTDLGALTDVAGSLHLGDYQYQLTYVRDSDGLEGGPLYSNPNTIALGGIMLSGLPQLAGYSINVYITHHNGDKGFLAGNTTNAMFAYTGTTEALALPCRTDNLSPAPVGTVSAQWRGRTLVAVGNVLFASKTTQYELFDYRRDFKQFVDPITAIVPVDTGLYVGTDSELAYLDGTEFDKLVYRRVVEGRVTLGSGISVNGERVALGEGTGKGHAMLCIADRQIVAGFNEGMVVRMTQGVYEVSAGEVWAMFREVNGIPQYVAILKGSPNIAEGFSTTVMGLPA